MADKRDKLRQHPTTTTPGITAVMARLAAGVNPIDTTPEPRPYNYTATGLDIQRDLSEEEFRDGVVTELQAMNTAHQLNVGDATLYGLEHGYIENYAEMAELTGYEASTIELYASLCRSVPRLVRTNSLTYSHYQKIAPLSEDEQPHWISYAVSNGLSYRLLGDRIAEALQGRLTDDETDTPPEDEPEETPSPAPLPVYVRSLPAAVQDKSHHQRMNYIWKKVEQDEPITEEDLGDVWLIKKWCDAVIERNRKQK